MAVRNFKEIITKTYSYSTKDVETVQGITLQYFKELCPKIEEATEGRLKYRSEENEGLGYYTDSDTNYSNLAFMFDIYDKDGNLNETYDLVLRKNRQNNNSYNIISYFQLHIKGNAPFDQLGNANSNTSLQSANEVTSGNDTSGYSTTLSSIIMSNIQDDLLVIYPPLSTKYKYDTNPPVFYGFGKTVKVEDGAEEDAVIASVGVNVGSVHVRPLSDLADYALVSNDLNFRTQNMVAFQKIILTSSTTGYDRILKDFYFIYNNTWNTNNGGFEVGTTGMRIEVEGEGTFYQIANRIWIKER